MVAAGFSAFRRKTCRLSHFCPVFSAFDALPLLSGFHIRTGGGAGSEATWALSEALKTLSAAKRPRDIPKEWTRRRGRPLIPACREGRELAHRSLRPPAVQSARRAPAHRTVFFFIFLPKARVGIKMAGARANLRPILFGRQTAGASPRPTKKLFVSLEILRMSVHIPTKVRTGLQARRRMRCPCGAPPPLTSFAESAVQSARRPLRRLGAKPQNP